MDISRRRFLRRAILWVAATAALLIRPTRSAAAPPKLDWFDIGPLDKLPDGESVLVAKAKRIEHNTPVHIKQVIVKRQGSQVSVLSAACTHRGCMVVKKAGGGFECPCHGALFSESGEVLKGPATAPLIPVQYKVEQGHVLLNWTK